MFFIFFLIFLPVLNFLWKQSLFRSSSHFLSRLAHICSSTSSNMLYNTHDLWGILEMQANGHKNIDTRQFLLMVM